MNRLVVLAAVVAVGCTPKPPLTDGLLHLEFDECVRNHHLGGELVEAARVAEASKPNYTKRGYSGSVVEDWMAWSRGPENTRFKELRDSIRSDCERELVEKYGR